MSNESVSSILTSRNHFLYFVKNRDPLRPLLNAPDSDELVNQRKQWASLSINTVDFCARELGKKYNIVYSNSIKHNKYYAYKLPSLESAVIHVLSLSSDWMSLKTETLKLFLKHSESIPFDIDNNPSLVLDDLPAQSAASYLKKQTFCALSIIANMCLALHGGPERDRYSPDLAILNALNKDDVDPGSKGKHSKSLKHLCFIALLNEKITFNRILVAPFKAKKKKIFNMKIDLALRHQGVSSVEEQQSEFISELTKTLFISLHQQFDRCSFDHMQAILDLVFQRLETERNLTQKNIACVISEITLKPLSQLNQASRYLQFVNRHLRTLEDYIMQAKRDDKVSVRKHFVNFRYIIKSRSLTIIQTMLSCRCNTISTESAWNAVARAQKEIRRATAQFQSQVPSQSTRMVTRVFLAAIGLVTLGLGALAIALYKKRFYPCSSKTYTGALAHRISLFTDRLPKIPQCKNPTGAFIRV